MEFDNKPALNSPTKPLSNSGGKKLTITFNARKPPGLPSGYEQETWALLQAAVIAVQTKQPIGTSQEELYKRVENLVDHKLAESLYARLEGQCQAHVQDVARHVRHEVAGLAPDASLPVINRHWHDFCQGMMFIRSIFLSLDRKYALQSPSVKSIWDMGLGLFSRHVITLPEIEEKVRAGLLRVIEQDRLDEDVDKILLKHVIRMLSALRLYAQFEKAFLGATGSFYQAECERYYAEHPIADVLLRLERRLEEEGQRVNQYLESATRKPLIATVEAVALQPYIETSIEKGFVGLMDKNSVEDLRRMHVLFLRVEGTLRLKAAWNAYIKERGDQIVSNPARDESMMADLLQFKEKTDALLKNAFSAHSSKLQVEEFAFAQKEAFETFLNRRGNVPAELLARFLDSKLKIGKESKALTDHDLETLLDRIMQIFRFISGKDVFEAHYRKDLAKRLLLSKFTSMEGEKSMIQKLKAECGAGYTSKLEGMIKDIDLSADIADSFRSSNAYASWVNQQKAFPFRTLVLTVGHWPSYPPPPNIIAPPEISAFCDAFSSYYLEKYLSRRLVWHNGLSQLMLRAKFNSGYKELTMSFYQGIVLMLFNSASKLSLAEIVNLTNIDKEEVKRILAVFVAGGARLLERVGSEKSAKDITEESEFTFRADFTAKVRHIKINTLQLQENKQESDKIEENVFKDRQYQAIVRIMKTRKSLSHQQLLTELFQQLKFPAKTSDLKKRIDSLIEREFIERDSQDHNCYHYLA